MSLQSIAKKFRKPKAEVSPLFYTRWSPRAMKGKLTKSELKSLFEAARWAPSAFNVQPWRFIVATGKRKDVFTDFLVDFNKSWCKNATALVVIISRINSEYKEKPNPTHSFDTGAAWLSLALEGARKGFVVHGMSGFDYKRAKRVLKISNKYKIEAMCAIGKLGPSSVLPKDMAKQEKPNQRKKLSEIVSWNGTFDFK
ncbi:nitroreductase family protein [Candidatus Woesearchaeota archaeon]|jgi:nitroreductase|nr:nitroreductase family protein [Candidatus Woesearchaeota archaeon]MBT4150902.1 nitroreductase family protein [Candidatus Woesearchaeota archaeon]MBT4247554.1 nitroreductase family protein [Candidatus Woesearchaeota archaeon]MBT4433692.1 nitroreductase family protein [Candidatus Woesearchaeota archaeon]MBT7332097.1 nitroreductase family protein [Candidatus Woesearchaeota archaeon]